ncbi:MAG TPA: LuxR C-terminal-related transcriptional regulator [Candidatus Cybelea sp.]|jgi:DNA-binding CsgD family transcriptional regulator
MRKEPTRLQVRKGLARIRASLANADNAASPRLARQCEVVDRYDVWAESRESICKHLGISQRTFYLDRRALLDQIATTDRTTAPAHITVTSPLAAPFQAAELLVQVAAYGPAAAQLAQIAANASDDNDKIEALGRLAQVECIVGRTAAGYAAITSAGDRARFLGMRLRDRARGALLAAQASYAFSRHDVLRLTQLADSLERLATERRRDSRLWAFAAGAWAYTSYHRLLTEQIAASAAACSRSEAALSHTCDAPPSDRATVLALRAEIDRHDPKRVHQAGDEDARAYALAIRHGMVQSACVTLYNTLLWLLNNDEPIDGAPVWLTKELARAAFELAKPDRLMLAAVALATLGRYDNAISLLARCDFHQGGFDWSATHRMLQGRLLFKAGRFAEAERAAYAALQDWDRCGLGGEGKALRIRAEALEALGDRRAAAQVVNDALDALQPPSPVHHLLAAYRCAARVAPRRAYRDVTVRLAEAVRKESPIAAWADVLVQTPRAVRTTLSPREREVALLAADGRSNVAIAGELGISARTVANHLAATFERLGLRARWQLTRELVDRHN